jgi:hypothetical protein
MRFSQRFESLRYFSNQHGLPLIPPSKKLDYAAFVVTPRSSKSLRSFIGERAPPGVLAIGHATN